MIYFDGLLLRANRAEKSSSTIFRAFVSGIPPLVKADIDFTVNTELLNHITRTAYLPTFFNNISDRFTIIQMLPEVSSHYIDIILNDDYYEAYVIDAPYGFHNCYIGDKSLIDRLVEKLNAGKIVFILTKIAIVYEIKVRELCQHGAIINTEITRTALVAKLGFLLANVGLLV